MKLTKYILYILTLIVIFAGCSIETEGKTVLSERLIYGTSNEIDLVQIDYMQESSKQFDDREIIELIIEKMQRIKLRQLQVEEERTLFEDKEVTYTVTLTSKQNPIHGEEAKGGVVIFFSTGEIVFPDIKTMGNGRTVSYISTDVDDDKKQSIISFLIDIVK
ncbi:MAG: hypothetical protein A2Y23_06665 [Clostridiales bacterium GWB2_37_7]|nr:MAG: hypothetical protein A2Y23_06665 [Clostridiales bacterium GWB2_37_7]